MLYLPDSPMTAKGFTDGEKAAVLLRIKANHSGTQNAHIKKSQVNPLSDYLFHVFITILSMRSNIYRFSRHSKTAASG